MIEFEFPKNVKQIGSITGSVKIYMEDYVCSYLQQYAAAGGYCEKLAVLIGRQMVIDGQKVLFISGAVQAIHTQQRGDIEILTDETWDYVHEQINTYFDGLEILGWMQSQPGYGVFLNSNYANYHFEIFKGSHQVLFVVDPIERNSAFFTADTKTKELTESKGYFIYYEKNISMHEYMLTNKVVKTELSEDEENKIDTVEFNTASHTAFDSSPREHNKKTAENKRMVNMLVSLSALLLVICFIMGVGLIQNEDRITKLEKNLTEISAIYSAAIEQIRNVKSEDVFAAQENNLDEQATTGDEQPSTDEPETTDNVEEEPVTIVPVDTTPKQTSAPQQPSVSIPETYTIQEGDSLIYISKFFYGTSDRVTDIMELNEITDPNLINFGLEIKLPQN